MATTTTTETINGKTTRHSVGIHKAKMDGLLAIFTGDIDALIVAWNDLLEHTDGLIDLESSQRRYLEAYCRNLQSRAEARDTTFDPANHEYEDCGSHCVLHGKYGTSGRAW